MSCSATALAQLSPERAAQARMAKAKWTKAEQSIKKAIRKDPVNPEAKLVYSQWYFSPGNPDFQIDSAYKYALSSIDDYSLADIRQRERMLRFPLDSIILTNHRQQIDSAAFERAKEINTEQSYISFLDQFTFARQRANALELRDEVAFLDALKINSYQSFDHYLSKYPNSHRAVEAKDRYEKLLFEEKTRDGKLKSYQEFYAEYAASPYRDQVARQIFEISTASGILEDYLGFIANYNSTPHAKTAANIAYHIARQLGQQIPNQILTDSLRRVIQTEDEYWVPYLKNGKFGFMNQNGKETIPAKFEHISSDYLCGNVTDDFLITSDGVVARSGKLLMMGKVEGVIDLGFGILLVEMGKCNKILHKSGFTLTSDCVDEARIISNQFLAARKKSSWSLYSLAGRIIVDEKFEDIQSEEDLVVLVRNGKKILCTVDQLARAADKNPLPDRMVFDDVRKLSTNKILVRNGSLEGVVNSDLKFEIPLDRQILTLTSFGFTKRVLDKVTTVGLSNVIDNEEFKDIKPYLNWLGLYKSEGAKLYSLTSSRMIEENLDSLWFTNRLAMARKADSVKVFFHTGRRMTFPRSNRVYFVKSPDSIRYFYLEEKTKKQLYEVETGIRRFVIEFDYLEDIGYNLFLFEHKGKKGLMGLDGKPVLPAEYDAIVRSSERQLSLLRDRKFGIYDLRTRRLVKASYERNLSFFNESILIAYKDGFYGFIDREDKPISNFEFDEIKPWSDSAAFVKKDFRWMVYKVFEKKFLHQQIKDYELIKDDDTERIAIIHQENEYGVLSNRRGIIIPATFSDVLNLGTSEKPLYFTEKNVEEARIFVVIYYDEQGKQIRRQIYESDEYDRIYCR